MESNAFSREEGLLGKLSPGEKMLKGKTFYLDNVKKRTTALLLEIISLLGGRIESFLHKDVTFVLTGSNEVHKDEKCVFPGGEMKGAKEETQQHVKLLGSGASVDKEQPGTSRLLACGSRGKALLEKAIRNNERLQKGCVLFNARSWGVKILLAEDALSYLKQLTRDSLSANHRRLVKSSVIQNFPTVKASALRSPYLKIEDGSRKFKPLHMQSMTFPALYYSGRFSPFESPPPPLFEKETEPTESKPREKKVFDECPSLPGCNPSAWRPRKKELSYCECCRLSFSNLEEHLQSDFHRSFVLDPSNYTAVDQLVAELSPGFDPNPPKPKETLSRPSSPLTVSISNLDPFDEIERAMKALQKQDTSNYAHMSSNTKNPPSSGRVSPSPAHTLSCLETHGHLSEFQAITTTPGSTVEPLARGLSPSCGPSFHLDPLSLPPLLSREDLHPPLITDRQRLYSDPPILSPQKCTRELSALAKESVVPLSVPLLFSVSPQAEGGNSVGVVGFSGFVCSRRVLNCRSKPSRRPHSSPIQSTVALNQRKRFRSYSSEQSQSKKRRTGLIGLRRSWSEPRIMSTKPQKNQMMDCKRCSSYKNNSNHIVQSLLETSASMLCSCSIETTGLKRSSTASPSRAPDHLDTVGNRSITKTWKLLNDSLCGIPNQESCLPDHSGSVCIEAALIPDVAGRSSSSDSDWDSELLSHVRSSSAAPLISTEQNLDRELLHRPCQWMRNSSYESHLRSSLQLAGADQEASAFSRTVMQIVEVQH